MSAFHNVKVWLGINLKVLFVCSPKPYKEDLFSGSEEESWRYWSLKTKKVLELDMSGEMSKRTSLEERRATVKPKGVVLWRLKMRSELGSVILRLWGGGFRRSKGEWWVWFGKGMMSCGISHLCWSESVILILNLSFVWKLHRSRASDQWKLVKAFFLVRNNRFLKNSIHLFWK